MTEDGNRARSPEERFDDTLAGMVGMPGVKMTTLASTREVLPIANTVSTTGVQLVRVDEFDDDGRITKTEIMAFVEEASGSSRRGVVLGDRALRGLVRRYERLHDRSTPDSRKRKARTAELRAKRRADHEDGKHDPAKRVADGLPPTMRGCPLCEKGG